MKRFILTSLCTLGLSLLGAFGINQNNSDNELYSVSNTSNVNQDIADGEEQRNLPADNITLVADNATEDKVDSSKEVTTQQNSITETANTKEMVSDSNDSIKKVNLSTSNSGNNVVSILQKNGYTNSTSCNIKNIAGLKEFLASLKKNVSANCNINKPTQAVKPTKAPTVKPTQAVKPTQTPTAKPTQAVKHTQAPTAKPTQAPTSKPTQAPTSKPTPTVKPFTSTGTTGISNYADQVLQLVNQERAKAGLSSLTTNTTLSAAANKRAKETAQSFSHTRPDGTSFSTVLQEYSISYRAAGENIAYGQRTPQEIVTGWMNSPGHRANILNTNFNKLGIGVYQSNGVIYWSQLFTN